MFPHGDSAPILTLSQCTLAETRASETTVRNTLSMFLVPMVTIVLQTLRASEWPFYSQTTTQPLARKPPKNQERLSGR